MKKSKNDQVQKHLDEMMMVDNTKYTILQKLREMVVAQYPKVSERIIYGGIMFTLEGSDFGGLFASKKHVSFEFSQGNTFRDPKKLLEGSGKYRRHLKITSLGDVNGKEAVYFIKQAGRS